MLTGILLGIGAIIAAALISVSLQSADFLIERRQRIAASPEELFPQINNLQLMYVWSPWSALDPNCKVEHVGPSSGVGAKQLWNGNNKIGEGSMEIVASQPFEQVLYKLCFVRPFKAENSVSMTLKPAADNQTEVTWSTSGKHNFMGKVMCLIMNIDKMVGKDFEKGLASFKSLVESKSPAR